METESTEPESVAGSEPMADFVRRELSGQLATLSASTPTGSSDPLIAAAVDAADLSLYSSRRPKHVLAGAASGAKNIIKVVCFLDP